MAIGYSGGYLSITAPIVGSIISFGVAGGVISYWDITPNITNSRNLGSSSGPLYWMGVYTETLYLNGQSSAPRSAIWRRRTLLRQWVHVQNMDWLLVNRNFTGSPFIDSVSILYNAADNTKQLEIYLGNIGHASTILWTAQNVALTVAGIDVAQTWTADQTFHNVLCNSGTGPFNIGSTSRGFDNGYFGELFVVNAIEFGSSNMALGYSGSALSVTAPIVGSIISFGVAGGVTSYWDITPNLTNSRNLGSASGPLYWPGVYTNAVYFRTLGSPPSGVPSGGGGLYYAGGANFGYYNSSQSFLGHLQPSRRSIQRQCFFSL